MKKPDLLLEPLKARDLAGLRAILKKNPDAARNARIVGLAGGMAWQPALALLKRHGADLNAVWRGYRPMHALIQESPHAHQGKPGPERIACLEWLLDNGADPELEAAWPPSRALLVAIFTGVPEYVEVLSEAGAKVDGFVHAALGDLKQVEKRVKADRDFAQARTREHGMTALQCCCASRLKSGKHLEVADLLLDHGADPNVLCKGWDHDLDVTYFAVNSRQVQTVELLLQRGAKADNVLVQAAWEQEKGIELAEMALQYGAQVDRARDGDKPLLNQMIRWGRFTAATWLLEHGASPNVADARGWTAVHQAASRGNERILRAVLDAGGDRNRKDNEGHTPLEVARLMRVTRTVKLLVQSASRAD